MPPQKTIEKTASIEGKGLFSGKPCRLRFVPAEPDRGIVFVRTDTSPPTRIPCDVSHSPQRDRRTSLAVEGASVETVEHVLAAVWGMGIDNLTIELDAVEVPAPDASPLPFAKALHEAGIIEQDSQREVYVIDQPVAVTEDGASLAALPGVGEHLDILYDLEYPANTSIGRQMCSFALDKEDFLAEIAPARTFLLEQEAREFQARGIGTHLTTEDVVVMGAGGVVDNELRFEDEHVRHKIGDLLGDLALLGRRMSGRIVANRSGHKLNRQLVSKLMDLINREQESEAFGGEPVMDIRKVMRLLPHRYPFLMIDRVVSIEGDQRAIGVKNVSINEPYFQGHYPGQPIMPGVMILEAMAQLSGVLLSRRLEHIGKVAVLLSMDRAKMRRAVRPGDQLVIEAEAVRVRPRTGHCRCQAMVRDQLVAEAEIKFMLVDAEPV